MTLISARQMKAALALPTKRQRVARLSSLDWTICTKTGRANSSERFEEISRAIESIIRGDATTLIAGRAGQTARLILARLAHEHGLAPLKSTHGGKGE